MGIFEYLPFSLFLSLILSQLFHPSWRWKGCSMIASRVGKRALQTVFSKLWSPWSHTIYFTCTNPATLFQQKKSLQRISLCPMGLHVFLPSMILCMHVCMYWFTFMAILTTCGRSQARDWTHVSAVTWSTAIRFLTHCITLTRAQCPKYTNNNKKANNAMEQWSEGLNR